MSSVIQYRRLNPVIQQWLQGADWFRSQEASEMVSEWVPAVDVHEEKEAYVLSVEIPGVDPKHIVVSAEGNTLTIKGEKKYESQVQEKAFKRVECRYGQFFRQFTLPERVDTHAIQAKARHGVLSLRIPKQPEHSEKTIQIQVDE